MMLRVYTAPDIYTNRAVGGMVGYFSAQPIHPVNPLSTNTPRLLDPEKVTDWTNTNEIAGWATLEAFVDVDPNGPEWTNAIDFDTYWMREVVGEEPEE